MLRKVFYILEGALCILYVFSIFCDINYVRAITGLLSIFIFFEFIIKGCITGKEYGFITLAILAIFTIIFCVQSYLLHSQLRYETSKVMTLLFTQAFFIYSSLYIRNRIKVK